MNRTIPPSGRMKHVRPYRSTGNFRPVRPRICRRRRDRRGLDWRPESPDDVWPFPGKRPAAHCRPARRSPISPPRRSGMIVCPTPRRCRAICASGSRTTCTLRARRRRDRQSAGIGGALPNRVTRFVGYGGAGHTNFPVRRRREGDEAGASVQHRGDCGRERTFPAFWPAVARENVRTLPFRNARAVLLVNRT
jgi:hypothetical protein